MQTGLHEHAEELSEDLQPANISKHFFNAIDDMVNMGENLYPEVASYNEPRKNQNINVLALPFFFKGREEEEILKGKM